MPSAAAKGVGTPVGVSWQSRGVTEDPAPTDPARSGAAPSLDRLLAEVRLDAARGGFDAWGTSTVVDELAGRPVIDPATFDALHHAAGIDARFPVGDAGLLHVYGYWRSEVVTPFGRKRDRWLDGHLAIALGLHPRAFHLDAPRAADVDVAAATGTTLLQRVTAATLPLLHHPTATTDAADVRVADVPVGDMRTRIVLHRAQGARAAALVYGVDAGDGLRLVTTFPVDGDPQTLLDEAVAEPRLRWNAAVPARS